MRQLYFHVLALAVLAVACNKEPVTINVEPEDSIKKISATIVENGVKTTYTTEGVFSWISGDMISYLVKSSSTAKYDRYQYTANTVSSDGKDAVFTGTAPSGQWVAADYAYYPYDPTNTNNTLDIVKETSLQATLYGTVKAYGDRLQGIVPMIGKKTNSDSEGKVENYHFFPVTGVLKIALEGIPSTASQIRLTVPSADIYPLNGKFNVDTDRSVPELKASDVAVGYPEKYLNFDYSASSDAFYVPIPTGTIPAGKLTVSVTDGTNVLYAVTSKQDIVITRGEITELPTITVPSLRVKISGAADAPKATFYFSGDVSYVKYSSTMTTVYGPGETCSTSGTTIDLKKNYNYKWPLQYQAYNASDEPIGSLQIVYYYSITTTGISEVCKQFTSAMGDIGLNGGRVPSLTNGDPFSATTPTITFAVSDDATKGNIVVTEFCGIQGKVYGSYVDYQTASGTPTQGPPQIVTNNEVFCTEGGNDYVLKEASYNGARFAVKTSVYGTPEVYEMKADLACWGQYVGLVNGSSWGPKVTYFFDPE